VTRAVDGLVRRLDMAPQTSVEPEAPFTTVAANDHIASSSQPAQTEPRDPGASWHRPSEPQAVRTAQGAPSARLRPRG
jgi:hypothetical protein